jgi:hypothetical protein
LAVLLQASNLPSDARWEILRSSRHTVAWELLIIPDRAGEVVACSFSLLLVVAWTREGRGLPAALRYLPSSMAFVQLLLSRRQ